MAEPAWYPDPSGRHQMRWWDGVRWTEHVSDAGVVTTEVPVAPPPPPVPTVGTPPPPPPAATPPPPTVTAPPGSAADGTVEAVLSVPVVVVKRVGGPREAPVRYDLVDPAGTPLAAMVDTTPAAPPPPPGTKAKRFAVRVGGPSLLLMHLNGAVLGGFDRPGAANRFDVRDRTGQSIGAVAREKAVGKLRYGIVRSIPGAPDATTPVATFSQGDMTGRRWPIADPAGTVLATVDRYLHQPANRRHGATVDYTITFTMALPVDVRLLLLGSVVTLDETATQLPDRD